MNARLPLLRVREGWASGDNAQLEQGEEGAPGFAQQRVREELSRADEQRPGIVASLERTDERNPAARRAWILGGCARDRVGEESGRTSAEEGRDEGMTANGVSGAPVQDGRTEASLWRDEWRRRVGQRDGKQSVRAIVALRVKGDVVDDVLPAVGELDLEFAREIAPDLGRIRRGDEDEVGAGFEATRESLRTELGREVCGCHGRSAGQDQRSEISERVDSLTLCAGSEDDEVLEAVSLEAQLGSSLLRATDDHVVPTSCTTKVSLPHCRATHMGLRRTFEGAPEVVERGRGRALVDDRQDARARELGRKAERTDKQHPMCSSTAEGAKPEHEQATRDRGVRK